MDLGGREGAGKDDEDPEGDAGGRGDGTAPDEGPSSVQSASVRCERFLGEEASWTKSASHSFTAYTEVGLRNEVSTQLADPVLQTRVCVCVCVCVFARVRYCVAYTLGHVFKSASVTTNNLMVSRPNLGGASFYTHARTHARTHTRSKGHVHSSSRFDSTHPRTRCCCWPSPTRPFVKNG